MRAAKPFKMKRKWKVFTQKNVKEENGEKVEW